jgi:hypothetical protein
LRNIIIGLRDDKAKDCGVRHERMKDAKLVYCKDLKKWYESQSGVDILLWFNAPRMTYFESVGSYYCYCYYFS